MLHSFIGKTLVLAVLSPIEKYVPNPPLKTPSLAPNAIRNSFGLTTTALVVSFLTVRLAFRPPSRMPSLAPNVLPPISTTL
jgi:hypothetical protein